MKILKVETRNVAGLVDGSTVLPEGQVTALAGANGTGKSKLLACLLIPWTHSIPQARDQNSEVEVRVTVAFDSGERAILDEFSKEHGWSHEPPMPEQVEFIGRSTLLGGSGVHTQTNESTLTQFRHSTELLKYKPSLDLVYLPAERRLLPSSGYGVDLGSLSEEVAISKLAESRNAVQNYGRLDDTEFENYAIALCIQGNLPNEFPTENDEESTRWDTFKKAVDELLYPKILLPLTKENSSHLRIGLPGGGSHPISDLSSGERQALIIISRVFRAGEQQALIVIDEPDAYLHPLLSTRLMKTLLPGLGVQGKLLVATHSPAILDSISPANIVRLSHLDPPQLIDDETQRIDLYREAGFRASALTQSDLLIMVEGDFDVEVLSQLLPSVTAGSMQQAEGRVKVIHSVRNLSGFDLPIIGIVDADVRADPIPADLEEKIFVWPAADIEGVLLQSDEFVAEAFEGKLLNSESCPNLDEARGQLTELLESKKASAIAEYAQRILREKIAIRWGSPRGGDPLERLRNVVNGGQSVLNEKLIEDAILQAEEAWNGAMSRSELWTMVRGKYIINEFVSKHTTLSHSTDFVRAVLARNPEIRAFRDLQMAIDSLAS